MCIRDRYRTDKSNYKRAVFIHVDSRSKGQQTDVFFYNAPKSTKGCLLYTSYYDSDVPVYRYADVLLMLAEC